MRWLRKAILRSAGVIGLHDEEAIFIKQANALRPDGTSAPSHLDIVAIATTFKAVVLEGLEVVFIVIATGAVGHMLIPASLGAAAAGVLVILLGMDVRQAGEQDHRGRGRGGRERERPGSTASRGDTVRDARVGRFYCSGTSLQSRVAVAR